MRDVKDWAKEDWVWVPAHRRTVRNKNGEPVLDKNGEPVIVKIAGHWVGDVV